MTQTHEPFRNGKSDPDERGPTVCRGELSFTHMVRKNRYEVRLGRKHVGDVVQNWNRKWYYQPKGSPRQRGDDHDTPNEVFATL